jgi:hypothetical protein
MHYLGKEILSRLQLNTLHPIAIPDVCFAVGHFP